MSSLSTSSSNGRILAWCEAANMQSIYLFLSDEIARAATMLGGDYSNFKSIVIKIEDQYKAWRATLQDQSNC